MRHHLKLREVPLTRTRNQIRLVAETNVEMWCPGLGVSAKVRLAPSAIPGASRTIFAFTCYQSTSRASKVPERLPDIPETGEDNRGYWPGNSLAHFLV